jgi:hypothetical protein
VQGVHPDTRAFDIGLFLLLRRRYPARVLQTFLMKGFYGIRSLAKRTGWTSDFHGPGAYLVQNEQMDSRTFEVDDEQSGGALAHRHEDTQSSPHLAGGRVI